MIVRHGLKKELEYLLANISRTEDYMAELADEFWERGGVCCPDCGVRGYSELGLKQERRYKRVREIREKLVKDTNVELSVVFSH